MYICICIYDLSLSLSLSLYIYIYIYMSLLVAASCLTRHCARSSTSWSRMPVSGLAACESPRCFFLCTCPKDQIRLLLAVGLISALSLI